MFLSLLAPGRKQLGMSPVFVGPAKKVEPNPGLDAAYSKAERHERPPVFSVCRIFGTGGARCLSVGFWGNHEVRMTATAVATAA